MIGCNGARHVDELAVLDGDDIDESRAHPHQAGWRTEPPARMRSPSIRVPAQYHVPVSGNLDPYDAPNGSLIGYTYEYLGFVPLSVVEDPSFDAVEALREVWGCGPEVDADCTVRPPSAPA